MRRLLGLAVVFLWLTGSAQVLVVDQAGREVQVPANPTRIASVFGVATPYLYALLPPEAIVVARYLGISKHPLAQAVMSRIDPEYSTKALGAEITAEELVANEVDLVFAGLKHKDLAEVLSVVGIPTVLIGPETFAAVQDATLLIGRALGQEARARELVEHYQQVLNKIGQATAGIRPENRPKVLVIGTAALRVASGAMYQSRMIELAGGIPVTQGVPGYWQNVSIEQVLLWNPEVIVIVPYSRVEPAQIMSDPVWQAVEAVKTGRVHKMPQLLFPWDTPIPESILGILWLAELLHPGQVPVDLVEAIRTFYREFYRCELRPEELRVFK